MIQDHSSRPSRVGRSGAFGVLGILLSFVATGACIGTLMLLEEILVDHARARRDVDPFAAWIIEHPYAVILFCIPALATAIYMTLCALRLKAALSGLAIGLLLPLAVVLYCFIQMMAPHYQYQPL